MKNLESMIEEIRILVVDEVSERLEERMAELMNFHPTEDQLNVMAKMIANEVKDNTLDQIVACIDTEIDLSSELLWDEVLDKWKIDVIDADEIPEEKVWESEDDVEPEEKHARPLSEKPVKSCPGCCDKPEKINEIEGIQTHIVDMEW